MHTNFAIQLKWYLMKGNSCDAQIYVLYVKCPKLLHFTDNIKVKEISNSSALHAPFDSTVVFANMDAYTTRNFATFTGESGRSGCT